MDYRDFEYAARAIDDINDTLRSVGLSAVELAADTVATVAEATENLVTVQAVVTVEDTAAELSSLLSRTPEISTVMEELHRLCVHSMQDAHAQLLAVHEIAAGLTVRILDAPAVHLPYRWPDTSEPSEEPAPMAPRLRLLRKRQLPGSKSRHQR